MRKIGIAAIVSFLPAAAAVAAPTQVAVWEWQDVPRVVAVGDLHGAYDKLVQLLAGAELVDGDLRWTGGDTHLVAAGDLVDRGADDRVVMDLLRRLQGEAEAAGGRVHVLLGNHEAMNLQRDLRYVHASSYRSFADEERKEDRKAAWKTFLARGHGARSPGQLRGPFDQRFPRGYFGRQRAFDRDGEYGAWLLRQPAIVKINGVVYLHGGLKEEFAALGIDGINRQVRDQLERLLEQREVLLAAGVFTPAMDYVELMQAAEQAVERRKRALPEELANAARAFLASAKSPILGGGGPLWYRGTSFEDERIERDTLERSLELVGASAMAIAHSYTGGERITSRFLGRLFRLDHGILESEKPLALVVERDQALVLDPSTHQLSAPVREPPTGLVSQPADDEPPDRELETFLAEAPVIAVRELGRGSTRPRLVVMEESGHRRRGIWKAVDEAGSGKGAADRYQHEVAAYRLDRRLGLGLVPVTVVRELDGLNGSLQLWVEGAVDQEAAAAYEMQLPETEATAAKLVLGRVFDVLIANEDREDSDVLRLVNGERAYLIDHSDAFAAVPEVAGGEGLSIPADFAQALRSLDRKTLAADLGALLDEGQIEAILARRDQILGRVSVAAR